MGPLLLNAFDLIILSQGLNLASIFDRGQVLNHVIVFAMMLNHHVCYDAQSPCLQMVK